ncbi:hypothetical protein [Fluviicola taffensis]|uniref:Uncharacterized protein n=1 Tax=Fluviicola taffensis (strain DSM 16823 / NCIMB 13979 / RW262) TaxID=755732 RepID=F2IGP6_FLUTR|nr:hypothetical protein [Fluviicola taffensis]AEA43663.1 hypothetical protein Fluta_1671 [Fluviicola taffensis DSM 16823]
MKTKQLINAFIGIFISVNVYSQVTFESNAYAPGRYLGWNASNGVNPLLFKTNAINRMKLNGSLSYAIDGYNGLRNGYLLLGRGDALINNGLFNPANAGAYSALHLTGAIGGFIQTFGYRPWMQTGITLTDNQDLSYIGLRQVGTGFDVTRKQGSS